IVRDAIPSQVDSEQVVRMDRVVSNRIADASWPFNSDSVAGIASNRVAEVEVVHAIVEETDPIEGGATKNVDAITTVAQERVAVTICADVVAAYHIARRTNDNTRFERRPGDLYSIVRVAGDDIPLGNHIAADEVSVGCHQIPSKGTRTDGNSW